MFISIDEDEPSRDPRPGLIQYVRSHSVDIDTHTIDRTRFREMLLWCQTHVGPERPHHPIFEAEEGWLDYFEGDWAHTTIFDDDAPPGRNTYSFWFARPEDRTLFTLTWL